MNILTLSSENPTERTLTTSMHHYLAPTNHRYEIQDFSQEESMIEKYLPHIIERDTMTLNSDDSQVETLSEPKTTSISIPMSETVL
jgi:hypothetical protein